MKFVVTLWLDGSGVRVGGLPAGRYIRIYEAEKMYELIDKLQKDSVIANDTLEISIQQAEDHIND